MDVDLSSGIEMSRGVLSLTMPADFLLDRLTGPEISRARYDMPSTLLLSPLFWINSLSTQNLDLLLVLPSL